MEFLKINSDGAFRESTHSGGWGFTIKNERGETLVAGAGNLMFVTDSLHAETMAMFFAIQEAARMGCRKVILETDASVLMQAMISDAYDNSVLGVLFKEMKSVIRYSFQCCKIEACPRVCNISAHCLAAFGVSQERGSYHVWLDPLPSFVRDLVAGMCPARVR
jgi:ribonuclease HI